MSRRLQNFLSPHFLQTVRKFWFQHVNPGEDFVVPTQKDILRWFSLNSDLDAECVCLFGDWIAIIQSERPSATDVLDVAKPETPLDWLSLITLFDQIPRNCLRGTKASAAYAVFDPVALELAVLAIEAGIPQQPQVQFQQTYRLWFYIPLEHSEELGMQRMLGMEHDKMSAEYRLLVDGTNHSKDGDLKHWRDILLMRKQRFDEWMQTFQTVSRQHHDIIARFGRFPQRNQVLGRVSTEEERWFLESQDRYWKLT